MNYKKFVKKCKKLHACLKKAKYNNVLKLVEEILDTYPEATFVKKFRLISYFEMGDYIKTIKSGKQLLENEIEDIVWEDIFWIVIAAYMQVKDLASAKEFYYLFKDKLPYFIIDFDREKLQFLMKINPKHADRYKTAIFFKEFLSTFHKITNNRLKHLRNDQYQYLWYKLREKLNIPPTVDIFNWLDEYEEDIKNLRDLDIEQARWLASLSNKTILRVIKKIRPSFKKSLSEKEFEELERIRCTYYYKVVKSEKQ